MRYRIEWSKNDDHDMPGSHIVSDIDELTELVAHVIEGSDHVEIFKEPDRTCLNCDGPLNTGYDYCERCRTLTGKDYR